MYYVKRGTKFLHSSNYQEYEHLRKIIKFEFEGSEEATLSKKISEYFDAQKNIQIKNYECLEYNVWENEKTKIFGNIENLLNEKTKNIEDTKILKIAKDEDIDAMLYNFNQNENTIDVISINVYHSKWWFVTNVCKIEVCIWNCYVE